MNRRRHRRQSVSFDDLAPVLRETELGAEQGPCSRRAEANDQLRLGDGDLLIEPRTACVDLPHRWFLVDATFPALLPSKVFDGVRDVDVRSIDACLLEGPIQDRTGRTDERLAREILSVAGLFADKHDVGDRIAFAEHRLCGTFPQVAIATCSGVTTQTLKLHRRRARAW